MYEHAVLCFAAATSDEFDESTRCVRAFDYTAVFLIDESGTTSEGVWDYSAAAPDVTIQPQGWLH